MFEVLDGALDGVRVVSLSTNIPGPLAAARLRALGASVIAVEPERGDPLARAAPQWYAQLHADIEVARLNLRDPRAQAKLDRWLHDADLLLSATRASALERMGLA